MRPTRIPTRVPAAVTPTRHLRDLHGVSGFERETTYMGTYTACTPPDLHVSGGLYMDPRTWSLSNRGLS